MSNLSDLERGMIIGTCLAGTTVSKAANFVSVSRTTVSRIMTAYINFGEMSSLKQTVGESQLKDHDR